MINKINKTILFLLNDTDLILLNVIKTKFNKEEGWESIISTSYEDAIMSFEESNPDVILTEIIINDVNNRTGFDFIKEVKEKKNKKLSQIIIFTELGLDDNREMAKMLGIQHYFVKSKISLNGLISEIKKILL